MGAVGAALMAVAQAKQAYDSARGPDPGVPGLSGVMGSPTDNSPTAGGEALQAGASMAAPQAPQESPDMSQGQQSPQAQLPDPQAAPELNPETYMQPQQAPDNSFSPYDGQAVANPLAYQASQPNNQDAVTVTADDWKPKKESVLGQIGDALLMMRGGNPIFRQRTQQANEQSALQGTDNDQQLAIDRMKKIDPSVAIQMQNSYNSLHKDDDIDATRMAYVKSQMEDRNRSIVSNMLGSVTEQNADKNLPRIAGYAEHLGLDPNEVPKEYDKDAIDAYRYGNYQTKDQIAAKNLNDYRGQRLDQLGQTIQNTQDYRTQRLQQIGDKNQSDIQRNQSSIDKNNAEIAKIKTSKSGRMTAVTKYGNMLISKDRTVAKLKGPDGKYHTYINAGTANGQTTWTPFDEGTGTQPDASADDSN